DTIKRVLQEMPAPDLSILNAGDYNPGPVNQTNIDDFRRIMEVNYFGVLNCLLPLLNVAPPSGVSHIAIVGSLAGYRGLPNASGYGPSKAAVISLAESLKAELPEDKYKIQLINPGFVQSSLTQKNDFKMPQLLTADQAATAIIKGLTSSKFEIVFPNRFALTMKFVQTLPYRFYFKLIRKFASA
ncbi:MAG: SDR family NAD(P)-dependent oxidoreductase, partial [Alphaproteobacteria bacterium]|nr:SDR family NAD(P)-dependent oxidoreductase [Alphaproteobacteria bacterium]